jgi:hypothetical protein
MQLKPLVSASALLASSMLPFQAQALDYSYRIYNNTLVVDAAGLFEVNEPDLFNSWLNHLPASLHPEGVKMAFVFNSRGGNVYGAIAVGQYIDQRHYNTGVEAGGRCVSACVMAWSAGAHKSATPDTSIGVHQASITGINEAGSTYERPMPEGTNYIANWLRQTGAPTSVISKLVATPPSDVAWLSLDELREWNVHITY